jgi:hypothetical protein
MRCRMRTVRAYCEENEAVGRDEGGFFRYIEAPDLAPKLATRMVNCAGCHDDFYNRRANITATHCWSLTRDSNFIDKRRPVCYH